MTRPSITRGLLVLKGSLRIVRFLLTILATVVLLSTAAFLGVYFFFARDLPDIKTIEDYHPPVISQVFADDGTQIGEFWLECRIFTPYQEMPKQVVNAFVDSEDSRFFEHKGVDMRSIARAFVANLQAGEVTQGGSTITQQITRSLLLSREKSISRKIREAILATRLERYLNKEQILTLYLNQIYLGNRAYGVAAAARNYYKKPLGELSVAQIALIAGLPTAPTNYSPVNNVVEARKRQLHVLGRMVDAGHITREEARKAAEEKFTIYVAGTDKEFEDKDAQYFTEHVRRIVKEKYGDDVLYHQGLKIYSTMNRKLQSAAITAVKKGLEGLDKRLGFRGPIYHINSPSEFGDYSKQFEKEMIAKQYGHQVHWPEASEEDAKKTVQFIVGENYKAIVTGFDGKVTKILVGAAEGAIRLENMKWAKRWVPGSIGYEGANYVSDPKSVLSIGDVVLVRPLEDGTFILFQEPLIQAALVSMDIKNRLVKAMVGGYDFSKSEFNRATQAMRQPGSSFKPFVYSSALDKGYTFNTTVVDGPVSFKVGQEVWTPKNYGGNHNGSMSFKNCIVFSRNIPTAKIVYDIGTHYLTAFERKLGITTPIGKYLSMALGANSVYPYEMVQAYSTFPDHGRFRRGVSILKIEDAKGSVIEEVKLDQETPNETEELLVNEEEAIVQTEDEQKPAIREINLGRGKKKIVDERLADAILGKTVLTEELNRELVDVAKSAIKQDQLNLTDQEIRTLYGSSIPPGHAITPQTAYLVVNLLKGVVEGGTGTRVKVLGRPAAGKTGTTNDETDAWFVGFVPDLAASVWVGFDEVQKIGPGMTGGNTAAPIFIDYMKVAIEDLEPRDFDKPPDFPEGDINNLAGGSSLYGLSPKKALPGEYGPSPGGHDRAGEFFEEDFESFR